MAKQHTTTSIKSVGPANTNKNSKDDIEKRLKEVEGRLEKYNELQSEERTTLITQAVELINEVNYPSEKYEEVAIFLGRTGSGKSTLINYLAGKKVKAKWKDDDKSKIVLDIEDPIKGITIGHNHISSTFFPTPYEDKHNKVVYFDCPGLEDTHGAVREIINARLIRDVITNTKKVKFIITTTEEGLANRTHQKELLSTINSLQSYAKDFSKYKEGVLLVLTHSADIEGRNNEKFVTNEINDILTTVVLTEYQREFLKLIHDKQKFQFSFKKPTKEMDIKGAEKVNIINAITMTLKYVDNENYTPKETEFVDKSDDVSKETKPIDKKEDDMLSISPEAINIIQQMANHINDKMTKYIKEELVKDIIHYYKDGIQKVGSTSDLSNLKMSVKEVVTILDRLIAYTDKPQQYKEFVNDINELVKKVNKHDQAGEKNLITKYAEFLGFFQQVNKNVKCEVTNWASGLSKAKEQVKALIDQPTVELTDNILKVSGILVDTKQVEEIIARTDKDKISKGVKVYTFNTAFLNSNLENQKLKGKDITVVAPNWKVIDDTSVDISGEDGKNHIPIRASNGMARVTRTKEDGVNGIDGSNGADGLPGNPGGTGGNFFGIGKEFVNFNKLTINVNGGRSGDGQDGGDGSHGTNGLKEPGRSSRGGDGGDGGKGGSTGVGGYKGKAKILDSKSVEQVGYRLLDKEGDHGKNGESGQGGKGGDGYEVQSKLHLDTVGVLTLATVGGIGVGKVVGGIGGAIAGGGIAATVALKSTGGVISDDHIKNANNAGKPGKTPVEKNNNGKNDPTTPRPFISKEEVFQDYSKSIGELSDNNKVFTEEMTLLGVS